MQKFLSDEVLVQYWNDFEYFGSQNIQSPEKKPLDSMYLSIEECKFDVKHRVPDKVVLKSFIKCRARCCHPESKEWIFR